MHSDELLRRLFWKVFSEVLKIINTEMAIVVGAHRLTGIRNSVQKNFYCIESWSPRLDKMPYYRVFLRLCNDEDVFVDLPEIIDLTHDGVRFLPIVNETIDREIGSDDNIRMTQQIDLGVVENRIKVMGDRFLGVF